MEKNLIDFFHTSDWPKSLKFRVKVRPPTKNNFFKSGKQTLNFRYKSAAHFKPIIINFTIQWHSAPHSFSIGHKSVRAVLNHIFVSVGVYSL